MKNKKLPKMDSPTQSTPTAGLVSNATDGNFAWRPFLREAFRRVQRRIVAERKMDLPSGQRSSSSLRKKPSA